MAETVKIVFVGLTTHSTMNELIHSLLSGDDSDMSLSPSVCGHVTQLLTRWNAKDPEDQAKLLELLYPELKRIAQHRMKNERADHTLQATALVNEFVVRLCTDTQQPWQSRLHFLAVASRAMRRILVDHARAHNSEKRGGLDQKVALEDNLAEPRKFHEVLEIHELLEKLSIEDPRMANVVELRYFGGLSNNEVAEILGIGERTVNREWQVARAWLYARMHKSDVDAS
jgi:RNA polymerase sigma factor (TIGR02999 family)